MISPETIALVKERTDLVALIGESIKLTRRGRSFVGPCPFHKEKSPSFHVSPERGFYHCFGCKESGSAVDFMMKALGLPFHEAVQSLADRVGIVIEETRGPVDQREAQAARRAKDDLYAVNNLAATYFEQCLDEARMPLSRYAFEELRRRDLDPRVRDNSAGIDPVLNALQAFRIGYAPYGWDGLANFLRQQGVSLAAAERVGLLVPRSTGSGHYDRFRHRLMFAVVDVLGRVVAFSGRALEEPPAEALAPLGLTPSRVDGPPAKYVNSPESPIYTKGEHLFGLHQARQAVRQKGEAILVEGNFDVVALHARGIENVVAPLGTAFTETQAKLMKRFAPAVVLLFDGDAAGRKATRAARGPCKVAGLAAKAATLPEGQDPDTLVRARGPEALVSLIGAAHGLLEHLIDDALDTTTFVSSTLQQQHARVRAVAALLAEEDDPNLRQMTKLYADRLAAKLLVRGRPALDLRELERLVTAATTHTEAPPARRVVDTSLASPEAGPRARSQVQSGRIPLDMLGALLDFPELLEDPEVQDALSLLDGDAALAAANFAAERSGDFDTEGYLRRLPPEIRDFAAGRLSSPELEAVGDAKATLLRNARKLRGLTLARENAEVVEELERAAAVGNTDSEEALLREAARRAQERLATRR